jgi:3-hydroxyisobutyrate dehydrogenase-like beta-hydroxyacid dehydrogenase
MTLIDMTTTSPELSKRIWEAGRERDVRVLDAPVTGGDSGARNGTLSILVGGDKDCFDACYALFSAMGKTISYMGPAGSGQHAKLANQIMISGTICGVCEALTYAENEGLDLSALIQAVKGGAAGSSQLNALGEKMTVGDYAPGFFIKHFIKDMRLASEEAEKAGLNLDILRLVLAKYQSLAEEYGDSGTQALIEFYKKQQS